MHSPGVPHCVDVLWELALRRDGVCSVRALRALWTVDALCFWAVLSAPSPSILLGCQRNGVCSTTCMLPRNPLPHHNIPARAFIYVL